MIKFFHTHCIIFCIHEKLFITLFHVIFFVIYIFKMFESISKCKKYKAKIWKENVRIKNAQGLQSLVGQAILGAFDTRLHLVFPAISETHSWWILGWGLFEAELHGASFQNTIFHCMKKIEKYLYTLSHMCIAYVQKFITIYFHTWRTEKRQKCISKMGHFFVVGPESCLFCTAYKIQKFQMIFSHVHAEI